MKSILVFLLILMTSSCLAQNNIAHVDSLSVDFGPAFIYSSKLLITKHARFGTFKLVVAGDIEEQPYTNEIVQIDNRLTDTLWKFLKRYHFMIKSNIDTVGVREMNENGELVKAYSITAGLDGITVAGKFKEETTHKFAFWSPKKETENYQLMLMVFDLMNKVVKNEKAVYYIECLSGYFNFGLGLKKVSGKPIKYKLYGLVSTNEKIELKYFFETLPQKPNIFIDVSNANIAMVADTVLKQGMALHKNIYWTSPNDEVLATFFRIGIPQEQIISDKKVLKIDSVTEKPVFVKQRRFVIK